MIPAPLMMLPIVNQKRFQPILPIVTFAGCSAILFDCPSRESPLFLLFLQEIISGRQRRAAGILGCGRWDQRKNSG
jgi:hypothetical protein